MFKLGVVQVAKGNELIIAISNKNYARPGGMLDSWIRTVTRAGVTNALVVALDEETKKHAESQGVAAVMMEMKVWLTFASLMIARRCFLHITCTCTVSKRE